MHTDRSTSIIFRLLVGLVALLVAAGPVVLLVAVTSRIDDSDRGRDQVESVVETMAQESAAVADWYFAAPEAALGVLYSQLDARGSAPLITPVVRNLLADVLRAHQNLDGVFAARPDGSFIYVTHDLTRDDASYRVKEITIAATGVRVVTELWADENFEIVVTDLNTEDTFDPRSRAWYKTVESGSSLAWTEPYTFFTSGEPGITLASASRDTAGEIDLVVGVDLRLTELGRFLDARRPGENGVAMVVSAAGRIVASAPLITNADERFSGPMPIADETVIFHNANEITTSAAAHVGADNSFVLLTTAADEDFIGALRSQFRRDAMMAVAIAAVSLGLFLLAAAWIGRYIHRLNRLASTDSLTGLPNRAAIQRMIESEIERDQSVAVMILDLDGFKAVNDTHGHAVGDELLVAVGNRLRRTAGDNAAIARLGGDEFIAIARSVPACLDNGLWSSMIESAAAPYLIDGIELVVPASGGVTYAVDPLGANVVLHEADMALYEAKDRGGNDYVIYNSQTHKVGTQCVVPATFAESLRPFSASEVP